MKKVFSIALAIALTSSACLAQATSTVSFTNQASNAGAATNAFSDIALGKFNPSLGTLTDVVVTINFLQVGGAFNISRGVSPTNSFTLTNVAAWNAVRQSPSNTLGFSQVFQTNNFLRPVITNPALPNSISANTNRTYQVATTNLPSFAALSQSIPSSFWSAYQSVGGVGSVVFQMRNYAPALFFNPGLGSQVTLNATNFIATANMTVSYSYTPSTPIPEPGTWAFGALLVGAAIYTFWRRRQPVVAEEFAPAA